MKDFGTKKKKCIQILSFFMSFFMLFSSVKFDVLAQNLSWSDEYVKPLIENGVFKGSVYSYDANRTVTYNEFIEMAGKLFNYNQAAQLQETSLQDWFVKNITDIGGEALNQSLTRQDAVVMLAKMLKYNGSSENTKFTDDEQISDYARESVNALVEKGYLKGYLDGTFRPNNYLSQGEAAKLLYKISGVVYSQKGIYDLNDEIINSNLAVVTPGITIKNAVIEGDLYISEGVGTGEVTFENVTVKGETIVSGGGMNSVVFINTRLGTMRVEVPDGTPVRVVASGDTSINMTQVNSESKLQTDNLQGDGFKGIEIAVPSNSKVSLEGDFPDVQVNSPNSKVDILGGNVEKITVAKTAEDSTINIASKVTVKSMDVDAKATVGGTGKIESASITAKDVSIAQKPESVTVAENISANVSKKNLDTGVYGNIPSASGSGSNSSNGSNDTNDSNNSATSSVIPKVVLDKNSEGVAGNRCITGLEKGQSYYIVSYKDNKMYAVMRDGLLGSEITEVVYDELDAIETDTITNLANRERYKVVKVQAPNREALLSSYKELSQTDKDVFIEMFFDEPIEFLVNNKNISSDVLGKSFVYHNGTETGAVEMVSLSDDKKSIFFNVPKKGNSNDFEISLSDEAKKDKWRLKGINADNEYKDMMNVFLSFKVSDLENPDFIVNGPDDTTISIGEKAVFNANVENKSSSELEYQWYRDGEIISGATSDTYSFTAILSDTGSKFSVKVWAKNSDNVREYVISKTAFLTVEPEIPPYIVLEDGSEGVAGDSCITGLKPNQSYYIIVYKDQKCYSIKKDGTLGDVLADTTDETKVNYDYDSLDYLETTTISNLVNGEKYKVVKAVKPVKDELVYSYKELSQTNTDVFIEMFFDEPIEFLVNNKTISSDILNKSFIYRNGTETGAVEMVSLSSNDNKSIFFNVPKKGNSNDFEIFLSDEAKKDKWRLKGINSDNEYKDMMNVFLAFTISDLENPDFIVNGPVNATVSIGEKAVFNANVENKSSSELEYQWYRNGEIISGATSDTYSFTAVLSDNESKFNVKVWAKNPDNVREYVISETAFLTVEPAVPKFVILEDGSEGVAGDSCITGLEPNQSYYIIVYKDQKCYSIKKDGALGDVLADTTDETKVNYDYDNLEYLDGTTISNLINGEKYKVVKAVKPIRDELICSSKEVYQTETNVAVEMFFNEPIEFLMNNQEVSDDVLSKSFSYTNGNSNGNITNLRLSEDKKSILFDMPKDGNSNNFQVFLNDEAKKNKWRLKGIDSDNEYKEMSEIFLNLTVMNYSDLPTINGPDDVTTFAGIEVVFKAEIQETNDSFVYQWYHNNTIIPDEKGNEYTFTPGQSDFDSTFFVKVWFNSTVDDSVREILVSRTAVLKERQEVILKDGSAGKAGNKCITGLEIGGHYYIIKYDDDGKSKAYPIMSDGTLGEEETQDNQITYKNLQPLETDTITGLTNQQVYRVVKVLPQLPMLQSLSVIGFTNNVNFYGFVPKTHTGNLPLTNSSLSLKMKPDKEDAVVKVSYSIGKDGKEQSAYYNTSDGSCNISFDSDASNIRITITVQPKSETDENLKSVYTIEATRATDLIITEPGYTNNRDSIYLYDKTVSNKVKTVCQIKYMKPNEKLDAIICKRKNSENVFNEITFNEGEQYTKTTSVYNVISINFTDTFLNTLGDNEDLQLTFKFSGGTTKEKSVNICICISKPTIPVHNSIKFGEPELIDIDNGYWLNVFVPVTKENGEAFEKLSDITKDICHIDGYLYDDEKTYDFYNWNYGVYENNGKQGILIRRTSPLISNENLKAKNIPNKYKIRIHYYQNSEDGKEVSEYHYSNTCEIPIGDDIKGAVEFWYNDNDGNKVSLNPELKSGTNNEFILNLTDSNTPFKYEFKRENESDNSKIFESYKAPGIVSMQNNDGQNVTVYMKLDGDSPELGYMVANKNSVPQLFTYDFEGNVIEEDFIKSQSFDLYKYGDLGYEFRFYYYSATNTYYYTVEDIKKSYLDPKDISVNIGTKEDRTAIEKTMQDFLDKGCFGKNNNEKTNIRYLYFKNVQELFEAFDFNPLKDTLNDQIVSKAKLNGALAQYKINDSSYGYYSNYGALNKVSIQDKNSDAHEEIEFGANEYEKEITIPYSEAAILTYSSGTGYQACVFDEGGTVVSEEGLILTPGESRSVAIVISSAGVKPKIYKVKLTCTAKADDVSTYSRNNDNNRVQFIQITEDMSDSEIEEILKSLRNQPEQPIKVVDNNVKDEISDTTLKDNKDNSDETAGEISSDVQDKPNDSNSDDILNDDNSHNGSGELSDSISDDKTSNDSSNDISDEVPDEITDDTSDKSNDEEDKISDEIDEITNDGEDDISEDEISQPSDEIPEEIEVSDDIQEETPDTTDEEVSEN